MATVLSKLHSKRLLKRQSLYVRGDATEKAPAKIPVFMLPRHVLKAIPEHDEVREGFTLHLSVKPHNERRYWGLISLSNADEPSVKKSAVTDIKYRSFTCVARAA